MPLCSVEGGAGELTLERAADETRSGRWTKECMVESMEGF